MLFGAAGPVNEACAHQRPRRGRPGAGGPAVALEVPRRVSPGPRDSGSAPVDRAAFVARHDGRGLIARPAPEDPALRPSTFHVVVGGVMVRALLDHLPPRTVVVAVLQAVPLRKALLVHPSLSSRRWLRRRADVDLTGP